MGIERAPSTTSDERVCGMKGGFGLPVTVFALLTGEDSGHAAVLATSLPTSGPWHPGLLHWFASVYSQHLISLVGI